MGCLNLPIEYYIGNRSKYDYVNDAIGRRTSMAKSGTAFTQSDTISYGYNDRSEVTSATATNDTTYNFGFAFDNIGNRSTYTTNETGSAVTSAYTSNNLNQYTAITNPTNNPTYDNDGNMLTVSLSTGDWTMSWNAENRLINITKSDQKLDFVYDYRGRRVEKKVTDKVGTIWTQSKHLKFVYETYKLIEVLDGANSDAVLQKIVWSGETPISIYDASLDATYYYVLDANKNISDLIDASGNVVAHYEYSPFGKIVRQTGTYANTNPIRFSSEYFDSETGLVYYNDRYYIPELARWTKRDSIGIKGGYNLYAFVVNNPINRRDKLGRITQSELDDLRFSNQGGAETLDVRSYQDHQRAERERRNREEARRQRELRARERSGTFGGFEVGMIIGGGYVIVECCKDKCKKQMLFVKYCIGATAGVGINVGYHNLKDKTCDKNYYKGWFLEGTLGPFAGDLGYNNDGSLSGTYEGGGNASIGVDTFFSAKWCYYVFDSEEIIGKCEK